MSSDDGSTPPAAGGLLGEPRLRPVPGTGVPVDPVPGQPVVVATDADALPDGAVLADLVEAAVLAVPGVHGLHGGVLGEVATYLPGRRVAGVRVDDERCDLHLELAAGAPLLETTEAVRAAVRPLVGVRVDVTVEDVVEGSP